MILVKMIKHSFQQKQRAKHQEQFHRGDVKKKKKGTKQEDITKWEFHKMKLKLHDMSLKQKINVAKEENRSMM